MILQVEAFDWNCPQQLTTRYTMDEIKQMVASMNDHFAKLEKEIEKLRGK